MGAGVGGQLFPGVRFLALASFPAAPWGAALHLLLSPSLQLPFAALLLLAGDSSLSFAKPGSERALFLEGLSQPACGMRGAALHDSRLCLAKSSVSCLSKVTAHHSENTVAL